MSNLATINKTTPIQFDREQAISITEKVIAENGNLSKLTAVERKVYYLAMCDRYRLDVFANPFDYLDSRGKLFLYPNVRAANIMAAERGLSVRVTRREIVDGWAEVEMEVSDGSRTVTDFECVQVGQFNRADAQKKAITQARRRAILAFCGFTDVDNDRQMVGSASIDPPMDAIDLHAVTVVEDKGGMDRTIIYQEITKNVELLGITKEQGKEELKRLYKRSALKELSDGELIDYADYLAASVREMQAEAVEA